MRIAGFESRRIARLKGWIYSRRMDRDNCVIANGKTTAAELPCTIEQFLIAQNLLPRSVVVEHNGQAVAPSEFSRRQLAAGDRLEIVRIVAGG
jgi:thiamine biosynthesis protein ThiS